MKEYGDTGSGANPNGLFTGRVEAASFMNPERNPTPGLLKGCATTTLQDEASGFQRNLITDSQNYQD
jgi:hypothetical protein